MYLLTVCHSCPCSYLDIFKAHHHLWACTSPVVICGFGVDRLKAEAMLGSQPQVISAACLPSKAAFRTTVLGASAHAGSCWCAVWSACPTPAFDRNLRTLS